MGTSVLGQSNCGLAHVTGSVMEPEDQDCYKLSVPTEPNGLGTMVRTQESVRKLDTFYE